MQRSGNLILLIALFFMGAVTAQEDEVITKEEAIALALERNYGIEIAKNEVEIAENNQGILNSGYLPTVTGRAGANYDLNDRYTNPEEGEPLDQQGIESNSYNASINFGYTLFDGLGRFYNYKSLKEQYDLSKLQARETIENTMLQLLSVYYEIARLTENVEVLEDVLQTSKERVTRAQYQFDYGQSNNLVVLNARVDVNSDSVSLLQTRQQLNNTKRDLNVLLDRQITDKDFAVDTTVNFIPKLQLEAFIQEADANNVSLLQLDRNLTITDYDIKISKSGYLPTIDLNGSYGWNFNRSAATAFFPGSRQTTDGISGGVSLTWNLFDGGNTSVQIQNAKIRHENQDLQKKQVELGIRRDIANALGNYENRLYIYRVQEENVATNQDNFERSREQFNLGRITSIEYRQAQVNLLEARTSLHLAKYDAKIAELELLQLTGQLLNVEL